MNGFNSHNLNDLEFREGQLPLLFPCSSLKMDTLPRVLNDHNIPVEIVNSYRTVPHPELQKHIAVLERNVSYDPLLGNDKYCSQ